ncbi:fungal-specific transcription factor domain-containing protein [Halenospora varia]|nr:fungal-specific transcription factor domain-containing protein [Halenospora varia]
METDEFSTPPMDLGQDDQQLSPTQTQPSGKPARRSRVALACQRCKQRKQKCNGTQPSCARCTRLDLECHYVMPIYPKPGQAKIYIKALEDRVAELETLLTQGGNKNVSHDHWNERPDDLDDDEQGDIQPLLNAVRDLSLDVAGSYVGGGATITLGRALESALSGKIQFTIPQMDSERKRSLYTESIASEITSMSGGTVAFHLGQIDADSAEKMVSAYLGHLYTNFPIMYSYYILDLHNRRHALRDTYEESILHLIYGLGGHFLEKTGDSSGLYFPERHYEVAIENRDVILRFGDTRSLTYLLLLGQHCLRMPKDPGPWTYIGLAMKMCIELGLHRRRRSSKMSLKSELNKRLFWSCYWWDREISIALGRPPSISDHDIDAELPLDVDEANQDLEVLRKASEADKTKPASPQSSLTCFIHLLRLRIIDSEIQHSIYRVDCRSSSKSVYQKTDAFLEKLIAWKDAIPPQSTQWDPADRHKFRGDEYQSYDSYMASYYKSIRVLLQPRLYENTINKRYLSLCADACRGVCETYKRLHYRIPLAFTSVSLQTVFLAGLTLVYCMWHDDSNRNGFKNFGTLTDCSIILYVMAERWPAGRKYRDLFESVKKSVLDTIAEEKHIPRTAVTSMKDDMQTTLASLQVSTTAESIHDDLEQMISDMTGEPISFWDDIEMNMGLETEGGFPESGDMFTMLCPTGTKWEPTDSSLQTWF